MSLGANYLSSIFSIKITNLAFFSFEIFGNFGNYSQPNDIKFTLVIDSNIMIVTQ